MTLSTSRAATWAIVAVGIACQVSPALAKALTDAGLPVWAHWVLVVAGVLGSFKLAYQASVSEDVRVSGAAEVPRAVEKVAAAVNTARVASILPPPPKG